MTAGREAQTRVTASAPRPSLGQRLSGITAWPLADSLDAHIRAEQVRGVYRQALAAHLLSVLAAGVVCFVLWDVADHVGLLVWLGTIAVLTAVRIVVTTAFTKRDPAPDAMPPWEKAFVISLGAVTLAWGLGAWLIMPHGSPVHEAVVYFFLMGVAGGTVASYSAHTAASSIAICFLLLPATVGFALQDVAELQAMAIGGMLYLAAALRSTRSVGFFLRRSFQLSYELREAYARVREQARTDELTGLANRRAFVDLGVAALDQARRYRRPLAVLMMDVDHFKRINDTYGHAAGDAALRAVALVLRRAARMADTPGRLGGEEFAILLPETTADQAMVLAERVRRDVAALTVAHDGVDLRFTCSIGVAQRIGATETVDDLLREADEALYDAKSGGRDRVVRYQAQA